MIRKLEEVKKVARLTELRVLYDADSGNLYFGKVDGSTSCSWMGSGPAFNDANVNTGRVFFVNVASDSGTTLLIRHPSGANAPLCPASL